MSLSRREMVTPYLAWRLRSAGHSRCGRCLSAGALRRSCRPRLQEGGGAPKCEDTACKCATLSRAGEPRFTLSHNAHERRGKMTLH